MNSRARLLMSAALGLAGFSALRLSAQPNVYSELKLPHRLQWGPFTVLVEKTGTEPFDPERVRVTDATGRTLREVRDSRIINVALQELDGAGDPELYIHTYSGGAHCCSTEYYFQRDGEEVRSLVTFKGDNEALLGVKDLSGDGRPELIAGNDVLAYFGGISYAGSPGMKLVIGWDGQRYVDQTRKYPERSRELMLRYQAEFLKALRNRGEFAEEERRSAAAGYWGNAIHIGQGEAAKRWLLARAPRTTRSWLLQHEGTLKKAVAGSGRKIGTSLEKVLGPGSCAP